MISMESSNEKKEKSPKHHLLSKFFEGTEEHPARKCGEGVQPLS